MLADSEYASPREVGQLLQITVCVQRGLVHLQQLRREESFT